MIKPINEAKTDLATRALGIDPTTNPNNRKENVDLRLLQIKEITNSYFGLVESLANEADNNHGALILAATIRAMKDDWGNCIEYMEGDAESLEWT